MSTPQRTLEEAEDKIRELIADLDETEFKRKEEREDFERQIAELKRDLANVQENASDLERALGIAATSLKRVKIHSRPS